jgi:hypothetical protein
MADNTFKTFPETETEALAMLYVQKQDLSGVTPEGLLDMYQDAYQKIKAYRREKRNTNQQSPIPTVPL